MRRQLWVKAGTLLSAVHIPRNTGGKSNLGRLWKSPALIAVFLLATAQGFSQSPPVEGRPILFVHGFCGDASGWGTLAENITSSTAAANPNLYTTLDSQTLYYDRVSQIVRVYPQGEDYRVAGIRSNTRFFYINFYTPGAFASDGTIDSIAVAGVSILNKADELAQVIGAITDITHVKDVIVIAHSMGGLVTRTYMQGYAIPSSTQCTGASNQCTTASCYSQCINAGPTKYAYDIAKLITLDTPHGGAQIGTDIQTISYLAVGSLLTTAAQSLLQDFQVCFAAPTLNQGELAETSFVIGEINANAGTLPSNPASGGSKAQVPIASIKSYTHPGLDSNDPQGDDGVVTAAEQSIGNIVPTGILSQVYYDVPNFTDIPFYEPVLVYMVADCGLPILHMLNCVGIEQSTPSTPSLIENETSVAIIGQGTSISVQATLDNQPVYGPVLTNFTITGGGTSLTGSTIPSTFYDGEPTAIAPGVTYTLTYNGGAPWPNPPALPSQVLGIDHTAGTNNWNLVFTLAFTSSGSLSLSPSGNVPFPSVSPNSSSTAMLTVQNNGTTAFHITSAPTITGGSGAFALVGPTSYPVTVQPNSSVTITLSFSPTQANSFSGTLTIPNDSTNGGPATSISLSGTGTSNGPAPPALISPGTPSAPGQQVSTTTPTFSWQPSTGATSYGLYVSVSPYGSSNLVYTNESVTGSTLTIPSGYLQNGEQYRWNMVAKSAAGNSAYTADYYFQVATSSTPPSITSVSPGSLAASANSQNFTINGTGFAAGSNIVFNLPGGGLYLVNSSQILSFSSTSITVSVPFNTVGSWSVQINVSVTVNSNAYPFQVTGPPGLFTLTAAPAGCNPPPSVVPLVSISWGASPQATTYYVYRNSYIAATLNSNVLSWIDPADLTAGMSYTYLVLASNTLGSTQSNTVTVNIPTSVCYTQPAGSIVVNLSSINSAFNQGQPPGSIGLTITDTSGQAMLGTAVVAQSGGNWLTINGGTSQTWTTPTTLTVTCNPSGLAAATYSGSITISSTQASNSPKVIPVTMQVWTPLVIVTPPGLPDAFGGQPYSTTLQATGGTGLTWSLTSGSLPTGLTLNSSTGVISGTPTGTIGTNALTFNISVSDSLGRYVWQAFAMNWSQGIVISPPAGGTPQWIVGSPILNGTGWNFTVSGGTPPYQWSAAGLPPGITIDPASGTLSGSPTTPGSYAVTFTVTDSSGLKGTLNVTISVTQLPLMIQNESLGNSPPSLSSGVVGQTYASAFLGVFGGTGQGYQWTITGALPPGISAGPPTSCSSNCGAYYVISGTPTVAGIYPLTISVTDSAANSISNYVVLVVNQPGPAPAIAQTAPPLATIGTAYNYTFGVTGGTGTLTWTVLGPLPQPGLAISNTGVMTVNPGVPNDCIAGPNAFMPPQYPASKVFYVQVTDSTGQADVEQFCLPAYYAQPTITSISPPYAMPNGSSETITMLGTGFMPNSQILLNRNTMPTTYVSATELQMTLGASPNHPFQTQTPSGILGWDPYNAYPVAISTPYTIYYSWPSTFAIDAPPPVVTSATANYFTTGNPPCIPNFSCQLNIAGTGFGLYTQFQLVGSSQNISYYSTTSPTVPWTQETTSSFFVSSPGTYSIQVTNPNQPDGSSATTTVSVQVYNWGTLVPTPASILKQVTQGDPASTVNLTIGTAGTWSQPGTAAVSGGSWLSFNGQTSVPWTSPATLALTVNPTGLAAGTYNGLITLSAASAPNSGLTVPVTLVISPPLQITTTSLANAYAGNPYTAALQATGGVNLSWQILSGALPSGLGLNPANGIISGTPGATSTVITRPITVVVQDSLNRTATAALSINWMPGVVISPPAAGIPQWVVGTAIQNSAPYSFTASGGTAPYSWSATGLPAGIAMSSAGILSGTPTASGSFGAILTAKDANGLIGSLNVTLQVTELSLSIVDDTFGNVPPIAPAGIVGASYQSLVLSGSGGTQAGYQWTITGALPSGVTAGPPPGCTPPGCAIGFSGMPIQTGSFPITLVLTDSGNEQVSLKLMFLIAPGTQTIAFGVLPSVPITTPPFTISATASSGLPVSFASMTTTQCTVSGSTVTLVASGTCTIQASQTGNANWAAATPVSQSFSITKVSQTLTFPAIPNQPIDTPPFAVSATASSRLAVRLASETPATCSVSGHTVTLIAAGKCTIVATQPGNATYAAATPVSQSFSITKLQQTIMFGTLSNESLKASPITIAATASSGLAVSYASATTAKCTVSGNQVTLLATGKCSIKATQAGSSTYAAATPVVQSFQITR